MIDKIKEYMKKYDMKFSLSIKNLCTGESFNINEYETVPSASTIKVFIMAEALRQIKNGKLSLNQRISVLERDMVPYSIITLLNPDNSYTIRDLITLMIIQSDNTATNILIDMLGMGKINGFINDAGFNNTVLQRKMMDFKAREKGFENKTAAYDLSRFMELLYKGEIIDKECSEFMIDIMKYQLDKSMMAYFIPERVKIAHKTGELNGINHDTGIVFAPFGTYIFTMMVWDAQCGNDAKLGIAKVSKIVYDYFKNKEENK